MKFIILALLPILSFAQDDSAFYKIPFKDNAVVYEKVFYLDSINDQNKIFNAVKTSLIRNTNYKYTKIDEDRTAGNISTEISFLFSAKPGIARLTYTAKTLISIDVKPNRFRVRLFNNSASFILMGETLTYDFVKLYEAEYEQIKKNKWKPQKSIIIPWNEKLQLLLNGFGYLINTGIEDEF